MDIRIWWAQCQVASCYWELGFVFFLTEYLSQLEMLAWSVQTCKFTHFRIQFQGFPRALLRSTILHIFERNVFCSWTAGIVLLAEEKNSAGNSLLLLVITLTTSKAYFECLSSTLGSHLLTGISKATVSHKTLLPWIFLVWNWHVWFMAAHSTE